MRDILYDIRELFASTSNGIREIKTLPSLYPAWVIKKDDKYGVCIIYNNNQVISEGFESTYIKTNRIRIDSDECEYNVIELTCNQKNLREHFSLVCADFVDPGINGKNRERLIENPINWWKEWKELLGNNNVDIKVYDIIAEMLVLGYLKDKGFNPFWSGIEQHTHDIETDLDNIYEVKATIERYNSNITINSQYQLDSEKDLYICFLRMEESITGYSINDMVDILCDKGFKRYELEEKLENIGLEKGKSARNKKFKVIERRKYNVDDKFPKITNESIKKIVYTLELDGIDYETF